MVPRAGLEPTTCCLRNISIHLLLFQQQPQSMPCSRLAEANSINSMTYFSFGCRGSRFSFIAACCLMNFRQGKCTNGVQEMKLTPFHPLFLGFIDTSSTNWGSGGREFESRHPDHSFLQSPLSSLNEYGLSLRGWVTTVYHRVSSTAFWRWFVCLLVCLSPNFVCLWIIRRLGPQWPLTAFAARGRVMTAKAKKNPADIYLFSAPEVRSEGREFESKMRLFWTCRCGSPGTA